MSTFGERMRSIRRTYGARGDRTTCAAFARELGLSRFLLHSWESGARKTPGMGIDGLAACFELVGGVRRASVSPRALAAWALMGEGEPPIARASAAAPVQSFAGQPERGSIVDIGRLLKLIREKLDRGEDARPLVELGEQAKRLGLAGIMIVFLLRSDGTLAGVAVSQGDRILYSYVIRDVRRAKQPMILYDTESSTAAVMSGCEYRQKPQRSSIIEMDDTGASAACVMPKDAG